MLQQTVMLTPSCLPPAGRADYKYVYLTACTERDSAFPFQSIVKVDVQSRAVAEWQAPAGCFVGEAVFVPRRGPSTLEALHAAAGNGNGSSGGADAAASSSDSAGHSAAREPNVAGEAAAKLQRRHEDDGYLITPM